ncbi:MAG: hypothetical protein JNK82_24275 [Myxococcaceae bacterium]|nr:hypothetical protein [Myxococcaceae bacterium]
MTRFLLPLAALAACSRPPAETSQPRGLQLERVTIETWHGPTLSASGTAARALITASGFSAEGARLTSATGVELDAAALEGENDLRHMSAAGGASVKTRDGCAGETKGRVDYAAPLVRAEGPVSGAGCGFELAGGGLTYDVSERHAEIEGPVRTRIEASR